MKLNKMKYLKLSMITICMIAVVSCGNDDDGTGTTNTGIQLQDPFILSLDENPAIGQSIGNINASSSSPLSFSILEQQFTNAIAINSSTGEVTVRDASFFDFETNSEIRGVVEVNNGTETATTDLRIDLNNKDDIAFALTDSQQNYLDAQNGDWIEITESEFERLNDVIVDITTSGFLEGGVTIAPSMTGVFTLANLDEAARGPNSMPNNSLVFAFKYYAVENQLGSDSHRVKQSSVTNSTGFENLGNPLPAHQKENGVVCFVMKGNETSINSNQGFLGFQKSSGSTMGIAENSGVMLFALGEASDFNMESNGSSALYEGLSTTTKQWD